MTWQQVQRAILFCERLYPELVLDVLDDLHHAFWVDKLGIQAHDIFKPFFSAQLGKENAERVIEMVSLRSIGRCKFAHGGMNAEQDGRSKSRIEG